MSVFNELNEVILRAERQAIALAMIGKWSQEHEEELESLYSQRRDLLADNSAGKITD